MKKKMLKILLLVVVVFLLVYGIPSSLGIYKRSANIPSSFTTARWNVSVTSNSSSSMQLVTNSSTASYNVVVTSNSDVDTDYSIIVSNIPSGVQVKLDNGEFEPYSSTVTFSDVGTILYGAQSNSVTHVLTFKANSSATAVNNQSVSVDVEFKQAM